VRNDPQSFIRRSAYRGRRTQREILELRQPVADRQNRFALKSPEPDAAKAEAYFERALAVARATGKVMGTARGDEHGAALARSGQAG
jgi:hypothetical protein